jgi:hypothetical protein
MRAARSTLLMELVADGCNPRTILGHTVGSKQKNPQVAICHCAVRSYGELSISRLQI